MAAAKRCVAPSIGANGVPEDIARERRDANEVAIDTPNVTQGVPIAMYLFD